MELLGQLNGVDIYYGTNNTRGKYVVMQSSLTGKPVMSCLNIDCHNCPFSVGKCCDADNILNSNIKQLFKNHPELLI